MNQQFLQWTPYVLVFLTAILIPVCIGGVKLLISHSRHEDNLRAHEDRIEKVAEQVTVHGREIAVLDSQLTGVGRELGQLRGAIENVDRKVDRLLEQGKP